MGGSGSILKLIVPYSRTINNNIAQKYMVEWCSVGCYIKNLYREMPVSQQSLYYYHVASSIICIVT